MLLTLTEGVTMDSRLGWMLTMWLNQLNDSGGNSRAIPVEAAVRLCELGLAIPDDFGGIEITEEGRHELRRCA